MTATQPLIFKDEIYLKIQAQDEKSGIGKYEYQMVADGETYNEDGNWISVSTQTIEDTKKVDETGLTTIEVPLNLKTYKEFKGTVYVRVSDTLEHKTTLSTNTQTGESIIIVEKTQNQDAPVVSMESIKDGVVSEYENNIWSNAEQIVVTLSGSESISGVDRYQYRITYLSGEIHTDWTDMPESSREQEQLVPQIDENGQIVEADKYVFDKLTIEKDVVAYNTLGIGRLIYQLPINLCKIFIQEIFGDDIPEEIDDEMLMTVNKFFENNLNVSETSRQLFVHRNTLVYRIEKLAKATGLDVRTFDDALTFKIALMVVNYMKYLESLEV